MFKKKVKHWSYIVFNKNGRRIKKHTQYASLPKKKYGQDTSKNNEVDYLKE